MGNRLDRVSKNISSFRRKYYLNLFVRGTLLTATLLLAYFLLASLIEYNLWLGKEVRMTLFALFFLTAAYCIYRYLRNPLLWWLSGKGIGQEESARIIGDHLPAIQDRLVNFLQLASVRQNRGVLLEASLEQKASLFDRFAFESIVNLGENRRYLKYLAIPFVVFAFIVVVNREIITQSTERIVNFDKEYSPQAPFMFYLENQKLVTFPNEDFELHVRLEGEAVPDAAYLVIGQQRVKMELQRVGHFSYTFEKPQQDMSFQVEAAGFYSDSYYLRIVNRPDLLALKVQLSFPRYIGRPSQVLQNAGNLEIPEGTRVTWTVQTANTDKATIQFASEQGPNPMQSAGNEGFTFSKGFFNPDGYSITLDNVHSRNKDQISYRVEVIKDQYPSLVVDHLRDSVLYESVMLAGTIKDDYGITKLSLQYQLSGRGRDEITGSIPMDISPQTQQNFFYRWSLDSLNLNAGDKLQYYVEVWDNDGVHGPKSTRSAAYQFELPTDEAFELDIRRSQSSTENELERSLTQAKSLKEAIEEAEQRLKGKQSLDWQDKKMLEDLIEKKNSLDKLIEELKKENQLLEEKKSAYSEQNERIQEKSEQIQKLMNELLDEETKKLFEELEKMLRENQDPAQIQKMLEKMDRQEINLEKELERTLELFKSLQYDYKLDQAIQDLNKQLEEQKELLEKTQELSGEKEKPKDTKEGAQEGEKEGGAEKDQPKTAEELAQEQDELTKQSEAFEKSMEELNKLGEELDKPENTPSKEQMDEVQQMQQQSKESLEQKEPGKATAPQKKSIEQMKQMKEQLEGMQNSMEMEIDEQNLESLRQIIHGLIKLSFDQESLVKEFNTVQQSDPAYIQLSQNQLKVKYDAKVLEDSLLALAKKDAFMGSIVTREVGELNDHLDKASLSIRERRKSNASSEMQLSMTSINNLALMLNDHFDMMMQMMQNAMPSMSKGKKQKGKKSMSEMQMQLNQQMEEIRKSGKTGRQLSEEMARMAAEQERIRRALQEMQEKMKQEGGQPFGNDIPAKMEQTELDLVNKQLTEQTIRRQKEIMTRLLESEKSMREQELDQERKGETAKDYQKDIPKAFEDYLRLKEKEVELLKTVPPKLYPYYKNEVNEYFKRLGNQN